MSLTKVTFSMIDSAAINAKDYGVDMTGATDSSVAFQLALNACAGGKLLYVPTGSVKLDNQVVAPATIGGIVGDGIGITTITYTKEQPMPSPVYDGSECAIVLKDIDGARYEDFSLVYTGTYYVSGSSYFGVVSGLYIKDCNDTLVRRIEATGFNCTGVQFASTAPALSLRNTIENCYLHHNRQSGCYADYQKAFTIRGCQLEYNGDVLDGGTGYGFSANTGGFNKDLLVTENHTYRNYRKGIDFHDGFGVVCTDNVCIQDRLHGIFYENTTTKVSDILISNNYVECDPDDTLAAPYDFYRGISVRLVDNVAPMLPNVTITGNILKNIYKTGQTDVAPIYVQDKTGERTLVNISKNTVRGGAASFGIFAENSINANEMTVNIEGNIISLGNLTSYGIGITPCDPLSAGTAGYCQIINNNIIANSCGGPLFSVKTGMKTVDVSDNTAFLTTLGNESVKVENTVDSVVRVKNNTINATNITSGATNKIVYGSQLVTQVQNNVVGGGEQIDTLRIANTLGSNKKLTASKALTAATLTDLVRLTQENTQGYYKVKWSAWYNDAQPATATAGGEYVFVASWSTNGQITSSAITALTAIASNNGAPPITDISLTWALTNDLSGIFARKLQVTANVSCSLHFEIEAVMSMDQTIVSPLILL